MERKQEILEFFSDGGWHTPPEVAYGLGISLTNASERLRLYRNQGLLRRRRASGEFNPPRMYEYAMAKKGWERLDWFRYELSTGIGVVEEMGLKGDDKKKMASWITSRLRREDG